MFIDTHVHIDVENFSLDRDAVLAQAHAVGVKQMVVPGIEVDGWSQLGSICARHAGLFPALGIHPLFLPADPVVAIEQLRHAVSQCRPVAIGEIGLDFWDKQVAREPQQRLLAAQLQLAVEFHLPVLLHVRKAHEQVVQMLRHSGVVGGIVHAYGGSLEQAGCYIRLGFKLGVGGMVTYARSTRLRQLVRQLPLESLVLETDAPDMSPTQHQGERNSPAYLPQVAAAIAELQGISIDEVARVTSATARQLLALPEWRA